MEFQLFGEVLDCLLYYNSYPVALTLFVVTNVVIEETFTFSLIKLLLQ